MEDELVRVRIEIVNDQDQVIWGHEGPVQVPKELKTPPDRPFKAGRFMFYGFTYQPIVKALLENQ
jgi:hypothetical protein